MIKKIKENLFSNKTIWQTIFKNIFWLVSGNLGSRLIRVALVILGARLLGPESWGEFSYALGIATLATVLADFGINGLITREASKNKDSEVIKKYFSIALILKTALALLLSTLGLVFVAFNESGNILINLLPAIILIFSFDTLRDLTVALMRSEQKMEREALNNLLTNFAITLAGLFVLFFAPSSQNLLLSYALGAGLGFAMGLWQIRHLAQNPLKNFNRTSAKHIIVNAWPFGFLAILNVAMLNTDTIMLGALRNMFEVGIYSAVQKPIMLFYMLPGFLATAIFPALAQKLEQKTKEAYQIFKRGLAYSLFLAVPLTLITIIFSETIIKIFFGEAYLVGALTFSILALTLLTTFPAILISNYLFAQNKQKVFVTYSVLGLTLNIALNFLLIPSFGMVGSAFATLLTQIISLAFLVYILRK